MRNEKVLRKIHNSQNLYLQPETNRLKLLRHILKEDGLENLAHIGRIDRKKDTESSNTIPKVEMDTTEMLNATIDIRL